MKMLIIRQDRSQPRGKQFEIQVFDQAGNQRDVIDTGIESEAEARGKAFEIARVCGMKGTDVEVMGGVLLVC